MQFQSRTGLGALCNLEAQACPLSLVQKCRRVKEYQPRSPRDDPSIPAYSAAAVDVSYTHTHHDHNAAPEAPALARRWPPPARPRRPDPAGRRLLANPPIVGSASRPDCRRPAPVAHTRGPAQRPTRVHAVTRTGPKSQWRNHPRGGAPPRGGPDVSPDPPALRRRTNPRRPRAVRRGVDARTWGSGESSRSARTPAAVSPRRLPRRRGGCGGPRGGDGRPHERSSRGRSAPGWDVVDAAAQGLRRSYCSKLATVSAEPQRQGATGVQQGVR